ncbi:hypothetical protein QLL95_gp0099 [Cotonvirus japonicus]|uniref:Uncharacterized protein n=1 Tax=Cotonvirus japonicus TaxID=2811091 RepID=A0ABM7NR03_9VIRU|nr:hypothetical protein QLL95_gp0099 [Cotonvirus japonicus]BCS82588.1 hypothetical protein [Cotonvirus japonicus]
MNTELISAIHPNHKLHASTKFPIGLDENGILRYYNVHKGTYANVAVHGLPFDYSAIDSAQTVNKSFEATTTLKPAVSETSVQLEVEASPKASSQDDEIDFVEPTEFQLELTYQRGQRLHGDGKKTVMQLAGRKLTASETKKRRSDRKRSKKLDQKKKIQQRQAKSQTLDLSVKKCDDKDIIKIKNHGYVHVDRYILNHYSCDADDKDVEQFWGGWFDVEPEPSENEGEFFDDMW